MKKTHNINIILLLLGDKVLREVYGEKITNTLLEKF